MIMLIGPVGAGKTSLLNVLQHTAGKAEKTQSIRFCDGGIDTPGEYAQIPRFYSALMVTAAQAELILLVQAANEQRVLLPPGFVSMFSRPVTGVITKIDLPDTDQATAALRLKEAGVKEKIFPVSAFTGAGLANLMSHISERGCKR
ncbi:EutP/PduV family microcompartment system protein [Anaerospora hongkongensis]|uniref:EutP/PduV family microcompartment system protein n=1 Tax=Anaerospora hongkongensis TaxID=244830 RepID=UPI00289B9A2E|nr:EutP/PduV family microcompartment system protein [Anaerospora hongkongensis]